MPLECSIALLMRSCIRSLQLW